MKSVYEKKGFANRAAYLQSLVEDYGMTDHEKQHLYFLADVFGPDEDFDGLITHLEDYTWAH